MALVTNQQTAEMLGIEEGEVADAIQDGTLRQVFYRKDPAAALEPFILEADVDKILQERDPAHMARVASGVGPDADPESPGNLAKNLPRL